MEKQTKLPFIFIISTIISSILHNFIYGLFGIEEPVFFFLTLVLLSAFIISTVYNVFTYIRYGKPKDIWKLGWLGLFGLIGLIPTFGPGLYAFFGFYAFFGLKRKEKKKSK